MLRLLSLFFFFFFNDTATTEIYTLSLHDALPILVSMVRGRAKPTLQSSITRPGLELMTRMRLARKAASRRSRSEEHTSELQSLAYLVCRLLLEKKKISKLDIRSAGRERHLLQHEP